MRQSARPRRHVDIIGIGAPKCGSTTLWAVLRRQPWFAAARVKETHYFSKRHHLGDAWYASQFPPDGDGRLAGEVTPGYLGRPEVIPRIKQHSPDAQLVVILRDPVARAVSAFGMFQRQARIAAHETFDDLARGEPPDPRFRTIVQAGEYAPRLQPFLDAFPASQIQVLILERVIADTPGTLTPFLEHLAPGRTHAIPQVLPRAAANVSYRHTRLRAALRRAGNRLLGVGMARSAKTVRRLANWVGQPYTPVATRPNEQTLAQLRDHYAPLNRRLEALLGTRIPEWDPDHGR